MNTFAGLVYGILGSAFGLGLHQAGLPTLLAASAGCLAFVVVGWLQRLTIAVEE